VDDGATVPLYYENRIPELQLKDETAFKEGMDRLLEEAELDEAQEKKLEREFSREYHLITRDDRLEKIAEDIVEHFTERECSYYNIHEGLAFEVPSMDKDAHNKGERCCQKTRGVHPFLFS
jgi:type I site-specific restriction-modification system R (restriction) subunit